MREPRSSVLFAAAALLVASGLAPGLSAQSTLSAGVQSDTLDSLPPWDYDSAAVVLFQTSAPCGLARPIKGSPIAIRLLAWRIMEDYRAFPIEQAVWWASFARGRDTVWVLATGYRHPPGMSPNGGQWWLPFICDGWAYPRRSYNHRPSNAEVLDLLRSESWPHTPHYRLLGAGVRVRTWRAALEADPPTSFRP